MNYIFILVDTHDCEPEVYTSANEAYDTAAEILTAHMERHGYSYEEISQMNKELSDSYDYDEFCFGATAGDRTITIYEKEIKFD